MNVGLVFALIFAIIVIMFFFLYGFDAIRDLSCIGSEAKTIKAVKDIETTINDLFLKAEGSSDTFELRVPSDAKFCFVDPAHPEANPSNGWSPENIFINFITEKNYTLWYDHCTGTDGYVLPRMIPTENFCTQRATLYLENKGFYILLEIA